MGSEDLSSDEQRGQDITRTGLPALEDYRLVGLAVAATVASSRYPDGVDLQRHRCFSGHLPHLPLRTSLSPMAQMALLRSSLLDWPPLASSLRQALRLLLRRPFGGCLP